MKTPGGYGRDAVDWTAAKWMDKFGDWFVPIPETGCWIWMRATTNNGYGVARRFNRYILAHRMSYELLRGPIPDGLTIDHLCRVRSCVNPDHMEVVTIKENILRGTSPGAVNAKKTHCIRGHEFTPENTYLFVPTGERQCRTCRYETTNASRKKHHVIRMQRQRERRARIKAEARAVS